jgi:hypothetical protein
MATAALRQAQPIIPDLATYIADAFEGTNAAVNVGAAPDVDTAERMILAAIERVAPRTLNRHEAAMVGLEVSLAWNRRRELRRAQLHETQQALHNPLFAMGGR